jgi:hypothetical protein
MFVMFFPTLPGTARQGKCALHAHRLAPYARTHVRRNAVQVGVPPTRAPGSAGAGTGTGIVEVVL